MNCCNLQFRHWGKTQNSIFLLLMEGPRVVLSAVKLVIPNVGIKRSQRGNKVLDFIPPFLATP